MRNDVFIANLARGAVAAGVAGGWMLPQRQTESLPVLEPAHEEVFANAVSSPQVGTEIATNKSFVLTISESSTAWDKKLEKEFRALAQAEAKGTLAAQDQRRLEELTCLRNRLMYGQSAEETSLQLKRDRLIERMEILLREYVEFQEATNSKRATA